MARRLDDPLLLFRVTSIIDGAASSSADHADGPSVRLSLARQAHCIVRIHSILTLKCARHGQLGQFECDNCAETILWSSCGMRSPGTAGSNRYSWELQLPEG